MSCCDTGLNLSHKPIEIDFRISQGSYWSFKFRLKDVNDEIIDLTDCTIIGHGRKEKSSSSPLSYTYTFDIDNTHMVTASLEASETEGLVVGPSYTSPLSLYYYDWELTDSLGKIHRIFQGRNFIDSEVTD